MGFLFFRKQSNDGIQIVGFKSGVPCNFDIGFDPKITFKTRIRHAPGVARLNQKLKKLMQFGRFSMGIRAVFASIG